MDDQNSPDFDPTQTGWEPCPSSDGSCTSAIGSSAAERGTQELGVRAVYNIRNFGAKGDGKTLDTAAPTGSN